MCILPPELVEEVLSRVPTKVLLRLRKVSKSWKTLIDNPEFIKLHSKRSSSSSESLILMMTYHSRSLSQPHIICMESDTLNRKKFYCSLKGSLVLHMSMDIVGSCRGLICLSLWRFSDSQPSLDHCILWNPCTQQVLQLPFPVETSTPLAADSSRLCTYGLGYDEGHDDYKVVRLGILVTILDVKPSIKVEHVEVYSLKSNCWRRLPHQFPDLSINCLYPGACVLANGALHWYTTDYFPNVVISLNLATEKYHLISAPEEGDIYDLGVYEDCLALWISSSIWVMKQNGVWTKLILKLPWPQVSDPHWPLASSCNHKFVVFQNGRYLLRYDTENKLCDEIVSIVNDSAFLMRGHSFAPSLVQLPGGTTEASLLVRREHKTGLCSWLYSLIRRRVNDISYRYKMRGLWYV